VIKFPSKKWAETDIEVSITHCGVCGSDVHTITNGWGDMSEMLPIVPGHEIIGTAVRVGKDVKTVKVGDRVGVGAQVASCYECKLCKSDNENYCAEKVDTYVRLLHLLSSILFILILVLLFIISSSHHTNLPLSSQAAKYPDGVQAQGGYSTGIIAHEQYVFPIPDAIKSEDAASMVCAGLTVYSPLTRHGAGPGKKVGIIGVGGLVSRYVLFIDNFFVSNVGILL
jgi:alcohol dehydrogenase (NADP+)